MGRRIFDQSGQRQVYIKKQRMRNDNDSEDRFYDTTSDQVSKAVDLKIDTAQMRDKKKAMSITHGRIFSNGANRKLVPK